MKKIKLNLLLMLLSIMGFSQMALAVNESEPNNLWNQADVITLGATGTGTAGLSLEQDWWRVTSATDGKLTVNFTATNGLNVYCQVYDTLGTHYFDGIYTAGSNVVNVDGLAAGTYYLKFFAYYTTQAPTYSFVATFTTPAETIDLEPNGTKNQAKTLPLNSSKTGHVDYFYNNQRDTIDWWKVTTNKDGIIKWTIACGNGQNVYAQLYDNDGVTFLGGGYTTGTVSYTVDGLAVGTYYIKIFTYYNTGFAPYTITDSLLLPPTVIDAEPNGTAAQALTINLNDSLVGHIDYYYNHYRDTIDWYKVTTTLEGQLNYTMNVLNGQNVYLQLYDGDGITLLGGNYTTTSATYTKDGLAAGTYYLKIFTYYNNGWAPYSIKVTQTLPPVPIDVEPNGTKATAKTINPNDSITGHTGYYYNHARDTFDYRKVTLTGYGRLDWTLYVLNGQNVYAQLYDNNATTYLAGNYTTTTTTYSVDGLAPGTYYLKIFTYYGNGFAPYALKTKFTGVPTDVEPNGTYATAKAINLNDSLAGNVGYYYNASRDTNDWLALTTNNDGQLNIKLYSLNGELTYLTVYDKNGSTVLFPATYSSSLVSYSRNDLAKGTYYINVHCYYSSHFAPYALVNNLVNNNPNDPEPNNYAKNTSKINGYTTRTGNLNYYYDGAKDPVDWWRLGYYALGNLDITVTKVQHTFDANYPDILYRLYKDTTLAPLDSVQLTGANLVYTHSYTAFGAGTFYIRITPLNNTFGGYSIKANYKDTTSQLVTLVTDIGDTLCGVGKLTYAITRGKPPYSVQLYKDGIASGSPVNTSDTAKFTLLDAGYYSVTTRSTIAATNTVAGKDTTVVPKVVGLKTGTVTASSAILKWTGLACVDGYKLQWKLKTASTWTTIFQPAGATQDTIDALAASTQYQYRIYAYVLYPTVKYYGLVSATKTLTTKAIRLGDDNTDDVSVNEIAVYPNPVSDHINFMIDDASPITNVSITNALGQVVKNINNIVDLNQSVDVSSLQQGIYFITVKTSTNIYTSRFVKE
ncbi:MAG: T9SS type A sorting domain-containing protein [Bacteroidia bacterium]